MTARIPSSVRPPLHGSATGDDGRGGSGGLTYGVDGDGWTSSPSLPLPPASLTRPATAAQMVSGMKSWSVAFFIKSTKKLCAVMLDTVSPELQVVNKSEAAISVEANGTVLTMTRARRPPPNCCPSTSLGLLML